MATRDSMRARCMPETDVDAEPEADVLALLAEHVVAVRLDVLALVPVGRADEEGDVRALLDGHAGQLRVPGGPAQDHRHRRLPAHASSKAWGKSERSA